MDCIICGNWFSSVIHDGACPTCSRAIKQLGLNMAPDRLQELAQAEKDGRLVVLQDGITVHDLQNEYCTARHMADEQLPSPSYITGHIAGFGEGEIHILDKILTREEAEAALKKREDDNETDRCG